MPRAVNGGGTGGNKHQQHEQDLKAMLLEQRESSKAKEIKSSMESEVWRNRNDTGS